MRYTGCNWLQCSRPLLLFSRHDQRPPPPFPFLLSPLSLWLSLCLTTHFLYARATDGGPDTPKRTARAQQTPGSLARFFPGGSDLPICMGANLQGQLGIFLNSHLEFLASIAYLLPHYKRLREHHQNLVTSRSLRAPDSQDRSRAWVMFRDGGPQSLAYLWEVHVHRYWFSEGEGRYALSVIIVCRTSQTLLIKVASADSTGDEEREMYISFKVPEPAMTSPRNPGGITAFQHTSLP